MPPKGEITQAELAEIFEKADAEIKAKGQAKPGDKTLIDALDPMVAAMKAKAAQEASIPIMLEAAYQAAEDGKEASKNYIAKVGKAKTLGERSIGYPDAGCVSLSVIVKAMSTWAKNNL
jgi:dihydroxyacetone kinase